MSYVTNYAHKMAALTDFHAWYVACYVLFSNKIIKNELSMDRIALLHGTVAMIPCTHWLGRMHAPRTQSLLKRHWPVDPF